MGRGGGLIGTEGGVLGNERKDISSTKKPRRRGMSRKDATNQK
jgi:hypothetical protein